VDDDSEDDVDLSLACESTAAFRDKADNTSPIAVNDRLIF
jgi:hypothetical protein